MERRTGIFFTLALVLICGFPGLLVAVWGLLAALVSFMPGAEVDIAGSNEPLAGFIAGVIAIGLGGLMLAVPFRIWHLHVRRRSA